MARKMEARKKATQAEEETTQGADPEEETKEHGEEMMVGLVKPQLAPD